MAVMNQTMTQLFTLAPAKESRLAPRYADGPALQAPFSLVHQAFEHFALSQPKFLAATHGDQSITYGELDDRANRLANLLVTQGLRPRERVCLVVKRSVSMIAGILAILKAGCQYVPCDGGVTTGDMLAHIFKDTNARFVLCSQEFESKVRRSTTPAQYVLALETALDVMNPLELNPPVTDVVPTDGAYVIYTSGTTGIPKGVDVTHRNVTNALTLPPANLGIRPGTKVAQVLNVSFDMGAWEILGCLMNGGTLVMRTSDWTETLRQVNTVISTPSIIAKYKSRDFPSIRTVVVGGERCPQTLADDWAATCTFINICGPTEVTILNTAHIHTPGQPLTIGKPLPNTSVYILDESDNEVPLGEMGSMWVGGHGVTRGYLNLPELTAARYKRDRFKDDGSMMFDTGDLVSWRPDGSIDIFGRTDDQVKIKGFRVELDGIATTMEKHPGVKRACATLIDATLWGFYSTSAEVDMVLLKRSVEQCLPYYAIPSEWLQVGDMPLTANGKVDKRHLRSLAQIDSSLPSPVASSIELKVPEKALVTVRSLPSLSQCSRESIKEKQPTDEIVLAPKNGFHGERWLRHRFFNLYKRLFTLVLIGNFVPVIVLSRTYWTKHELRLEDISTATAANLTVAVLMRQEYVINLLFTIACAVPTWAPLCIRRQCARVFHIGGLHSGCAVMAVMWFIAFTITATMYRVNHEPSVSLAALVMSYLVLGLLLLILAGAWPDFRAKYHNHFEVVHRFAGWTSLGLIWVQAVLATDSLRPATVPLGRALIQSPTFWLLIIITASIILPWLRLRRVIVYPERLSDHATRLHFTYTSTYPGTAVRLSERPLLEWHAFATIADPAKPDGFSLVISNAGDWTKRTIDTSPTKLWVRGIPACGVLRIAPLFKSIVLVATGSGIGPCLPVILAKRVPCRIFWSTPHPRETYGNEIVDSVLDTDPNAVIHNTRTMGKPDMVAISYRLYNEMPGCEAVCIISNRKLTEKVVYAMESRGVPAYGAIWDS